MTAPDRIAGMTLAEWREFARLDNCLELMVPSELRLLIAAIPEPRATPAAMTPEVRALVEAAAKTRAAQKAYFRDRTRENLIASKQAEAELDAALAALRAGGDG